MLIDINLLPEKEKKRTPILFPILLILLLVIAGIGAFLWIQSKKVELELVESQLKTANQLRETLEMNVNEPAGDAEDVDKLNEAIHWVEGKKIQSVPILKHLIELLPERGFFLAVSNTNNETFTLSVQFDSSRQAAYYLSELKASHWVKTAELSSLTTSVQEGEEEAKALLEYLNILPRYEAQYTITIDKDFVLQKQREADKREAGTP